MAQVLASILAGVTAATMVVALAQLVLECRGPRITTRRGGRSKTGPASRLLIGLGRSLLESSGRSHRRLVVGLDLALLKAGSPMGLTGRELMALKVGFAVLGFAGFGLALLSQAGRPATVLAALLPVVCFLLPDFYLRRLGQQRAVAIVDELPAFLDIMRVTVASGMSLQRSIEVTAGRLSGVLAVEFQRVAKMQQLGHPRKEALDELTRRTQVSEVEALVRALESAERHGVAVVDTLVRQARAARESRRRAIQEAAAKAGPKVQLVVALVLVPAVLLLFVAAILGKILDGGLGGLSILG